MHVIRGISASLFCISIAFPIRGQSVASVPAQQTTLGLRMGTDFDADGVDVYRTIVGAQLDRGLSNHWHVTASLNLYPTVADGAFWLSTDLKFRPPLVTNLIYFGTGATASNGGAHRDHFGADILVGSEPRLPWLLRPFAEAKWVLFQRYTSFTVQGGLELVL